MTELDLEALGACSDAQEWYAEHGGPPDRAWEDCPRGDWLLWLAARARVDRRLVVLAACDCAETADGYLDERTRGPARAALDAARRWTRGEATSADVASAARAAAAAASDAYVGDAASSAACAASASAAYVADAATANASAASAARAAAVASVASVASVAGAGAARSESLARCAVLVRAHITWALVAAALEAFRG